MPRKAKKASFSTGVPKTVWVYLGGLSLFGMLACSGYLWNKNQIDALGAQIRQHEVRLDEAKRKRAALDRTYAMMCSPADLDARVKRMRLEIGPPQQDQIVRLCEPTPTTEDKLVAQSVALKREETH